MIELGRYEPRGNGLAKSVIVIKPKIKWVSLYTTIRDNSYKKIQSFILNVSRRPVTDLILGLMNSANYFENMQLIKCISSYFDSRNKMLSI